MPFKGFNSILFDFDSVIDIELSVIRWLANTYKDSELDNFDKHRLLHTSLDDMEFMRVFGYKGEDLFRSLITNEELKDKYIEILNSFYNEYESEILSKDNMMKTSMTNLISAYRKAGNGTISTAIRCDSEEQKKCIRSFDSIVPIELCERKDVDMSKYGRLIVGNVFDPMEYIFKEPKSIVVLNFRENMSVDNITLLRPELIISLGDINDFDVISSYRSVDTKNISG